MRAGLYSRVSREEQLEGYSIEEQLDAMRRFCEEHGWTIAAEYVEPGHTGTVKERPAFSEALADCEAGKVDILLTHQLDRFFRNLRLQLETLGQLGKWGVGYLSVTEQIDYSTPQGMLFLSMLGAFNEYYVANLRREIRKGKRGRAKKGLSNAAIPPPGYQRIEGQTVLVIKEDEARAVRRAFELYATGTYSLARLARQLNTEGLPAGQQSRDGKWTRSAIGIILANPFYVGMVTHTNTATGEVTLYPGEHEPIISQELWDRVQEVRQRRAVEKRREPVKHFYLLQSLLVCVHCGRRLHSDMNRSAKKTYYYYTDPARRRKHLDCPVAKLTVHVQVFDDQVAELVKRLQLPDDWRERLEELSEHREERDQVAGKRRYLEGKLRRLRDLYLEGDFDKSEYNRRKSEIQSQLRALQVPEMPEVEQAGEALESLGAEWASAPKRYQREMLLTIFDAIYVDLETQKVIYVKPHAPFAPLFRMDGLEEKENGCFYYEEGKDTRSED